jgi:hypothetical protein
MNLALSDFRFEHADPSIFPDRPCFIAHIGCIWYELLPVHTTLDVVMNAVVKHANTCTTQRKDR